MHGGERLKCGGKRMVGMTGDRLGPIVMVNGLGGSVDGTWLHLRFRFLFHDVALLVWPVGLPNVCCG